MKYSTVLISFIILAPALSSAAIEPTLSQLLSREAASKALNEGKTLACAMGTDRSSVTTGGLFTLAWGTYGAAEPGTTGRSELVPRDEIQMRAGVPGVWKYTLTFRDMSGQEVTCAVFITVTR